MTVIGQCIGIEKFGAESQDETENNETLHE